MPRQPNHYMHESRQIHGLVRRKDGLFTPAGRAGRGIYFGRDPIEAIRQFRKWQAQQSEVPAVAVTAFHQVEPGVHQLNKKATALMDDLDFWEMVKNLILTKPKYVAERTGIEEIGYLQDLRPPTESLGLDRVVKLYNERKREISRAETTHGETTWKQFLRYVRKIGPAERFSDITKEQMNQYHEQIHGNDYANKTLSKKYSKLRHMLRYALARTEDDHIRRVLDLMQILETNGRTTKNDPKPVSKEDFIKLLKTAKAMTFERDAVNGVLWNAILLTAVNCCYYGRDVRDLQTKHCNLTRGTVVFRRGKTGVARVAVLWARTIKAIRDYQKESPHGLDYIFANYDNHDGVWRQLHDTTIIRQFNKIARKAEMSHLAFSMVRDGGGTAAATEGATEQQYKIIMGHSCGISDNYIMRNPKMVEGACKLIEKHFFGGTK